MKVPTRIALSVGASLLALALGAACGGGNGDAPNKGNVSPTATEAASSSDPVSGDAITISMTDNAFDSNSITIPVNTTVLVTVLNDGQAPHNMHVLSKDAEGKDFMSDMLVNPGASSTFEIMFTTKGEFTFQCDFHLPDMVGTITVQ